MALTITFEKFAKKQREANPDITDAEIEQLWSEQPLNKRIASGIESAVLTPGRAIAGIPEAIGAGYKKLDEISRSGPDLSFKYEGGDKAVIGGTPNQTLYESLPRPTIAKQEKKLPDLPEMKTLEEGPKTLSESLQDKSTPEVKQKAKKGLAATDTVAKNAQTAADRGEIPQSAADRFKEERDRAYQMYNEAKTRNEWLELAQLLGQTATQYGAARVGVRTGRDMTGIQIPSIDFGARTEREAKLLQTRLGDIEEQQKLEQREKERQQEKEYNDLRIGLLREQTRNEKAAAAGKLSAEERLERTTLKDMLTKQIDAAQKSYTAALTFANQAAMEEDLSPKSLKKIEEKAPGLLAQAKIDPTELAQIEKDATKKGWVWDSIDKEKKQQLIKERILNKHTNILAELQTQIDQLAGRSSRQQATPSGTMPSGGKVKVRKGSEVLEIPESDLAAARADGYELER